MASQVQVNMFDDRIEVVSPGGLYGTVTVDNIGEYGSSSSRNQFLSRILESTPYPEDSPEHGYVVENKGTGFVQIQAALKNQGMNPAEPADSISLFVVTMRKKAGVGAAPSFSKALGGAAKGESDPILDFVRANGSAASSEISEVLGVSRSTANRRIKKLVKLGALTTNGGQGRSIRYLLPR
nr:ATP-binding protein [Collinsella acetigenes]